MSVASFSNACLSSCSAARMNLSSTGILRRTTITFKSTAIVFHEAIVSLSTAYLKYLNNSASACIKTKRIISSLLFPIGKKSMSIIEYAPGPIIDIVFAFALNQIRNKLCLQLQKVISSMVRSKRDRIFNPSTTDLSLPRRGRSVVRASFDGHGATLLTWVRITRETSDASLSLTPRH